MKKFIKSIYDQFGIIADDFDNGRRLWAIAQMIIIIIIGASIILGGLWLCQQIYFNISYIILAILGFFCFVALWRRFFPQKQPQQIEAPPENNTVMYDAVFLENSYKMLLTNICPIIMEKADIMQVHKPMAYYELEAPIHYTVKSYVMFHILMGKNAESVDTQRILEILQNTISQKLNNSEMVGISQACYFYNGQALPSIMIDSARDLGNFIQVDIVITCDAYCLHRINRLQSSISNATASKPRDRDF